MSKNPTLSAMKREITGRKVKQLRRQGIIPANIFGSNIKSEAVQVDSKAFKKTYDDAGETSVIDLTLGESKTTRPVMIHGIKLNPVTEAILHIDFLQVDLTKKISTQVPVEIVGESLAVKEKGGVMLVALNELEIEALPQDIPDVIQVDISSLAEIGDSILVQDIKLSSKADILTDLETTLVVIQEQTQEEEPEPIEPETAEDADAETAPEEESSPTESSDGDVKPDQAE